jgi:HK97 family phage major capsid protein
MPRLCVILYPQQPANLTIAGSGSIGRNGEGNTKPSVDYAFKTITLNLTFLAGIARVSKEMLMDLPWLQTYLANSLVEDFKRQEDAEYLATLVAGAQTGTTSETIAGAKALDYVVQILGQGRKVSVILLSPTAYAGVLKSRPNDYSIPGGVSYDPAGNISVFGIPVVMAQFMSGSTMLAGDFNFGAAIAQAWGLTLQSTEFDGTNWSKNMVSVCMEAREGLAVFSPKSFVYGTI